ncbi:MAG: EamA family transporter [Clostridia bacterium]|nr:EamA family transporter [Clostridia bacterium]
MAYFYLFLIVVFVTAQNILSKKYNSASHINVFLYNAVTSFSSMLFFLVAAGGRFELSSAYLPYSLAFGTACFCALAGLVLALKNGSLSLTSLITSYSLILPTLHGMIFLNERVGYLSLIGIAFLLVSLVLINFKRGTTRNSALPGSFI